METAPITSTTIPVSAPAHAAPLSWSAIFAGATAALAAALVLTLAAMGLGYTLSFSGLASRGSLTGFTPIGGAWAIVIQVLSAALGGYLAGRLRHPWREAHLDEAHFRDTAHGLLAWALATIAGVVLAAMVLAPYAETLAPDALASAPTPADAARAASIAAQSSLFAAIGMLLAAFVAAVAARIGGLRNEVMIARFSH